MGRISERSARGGSTWRAKRVRERAARQGFLFVIGPVIIFGALLGMVAPIDYPPGDIRGDVVFGVVTLGAVIAFAILGMVASARWLLGERRQ
jgi:hypothetical protein